MFKKVMCKTKEENHIGLQITVNWKPVKELDLLTYVGVVIEWWEDRSRIITRINKVTTMYYQLYKTETNKQIQNKILWLCEFSHSDIQNQKLELKK